MHKVVILQRFVPHYRLRLFERLWREFGWCVATAEQVPDIGRLHGFSTVDSEHPFIKRFNFDFPWNNSIYRCNVPVRRILDETQATAIVSEFAMYMSSTYQLTALRRMRGSPTLLFWSHGYSMERGLSSLGDRILQWPRALICAMADGHICYSEEGREYLSRIMARERLFVAPNTIDIQNVQQSAGDAPSMEAPGWPHIVTVGRITENKDLPRLIRVFRALRVDYPKAALTIVGDGPDRQHVIETAGKDLGRSIFMPGAVYDETRIAEYFGCADLSVVTGAAGLGVNHALSHGVPVIAFERTTRGPNHHPEIAYVVNDVTGFKVPRYTDEAMIEELRGFLSHYPDPRSAFANSIGRYVDHHLSLQGMVREFAKVDEFIRKRSCRAA